MGSRLPAVLGTGRLAGRIEQLELEERDAVRRGDWATARSKAEEKAALKEAQHRAVARRRR